MWISDTEASHITNLWRGWGVVGAIVGTVGIVATVIAGTRGLRAVTLIAGAAVIIALRDVMTFDYPTIFYGPYEVVRWIILLVMIAIFVIPILMSLISQGGATS
jgi:hypothetical protein